MVGKTLDFLEESLHSNYKDFNEMVDQLIEVQMIMYNKSDHLIADMHEEEAEQKRAEQSQLWVT